jgi:hypothetical protein
MDMLEFVILLLIAMVILIWFLAAAVMIGIGYILVTERLDWARFLLGIFFLVWGVIFLLLPIALIW